MSIPRSLIEKLKKKLKRKALEARRMLIKIACQSGSTHVGSSLSEVDLLTALYFDILRVNPASPRDPRRDRFILSKGHGALGFYVTLWQRGFISKQRLENYGKDGTVLAGHPVYRSAPGIEATTGSLGHGLPMAVGMTLAAKRDGQRWRCFVLLSDGECDEGSTWEAVLLAGHLKLDNLIAIVDYNKIQSFGTVKEVLDLEPLAEKWKAAHWATREIDGHDFREILNVLRKVPLAKRKPTAFIAHTIKGKGVPYMEGKLEWHYRNVTPEMLAETLQLIY